MGFALNLDLLHSRQGSRQLIFPGGICRLDLQSAHPAEEGIDQNKIIRKTAAAQPFFGSGQTGYL